MEGERGWEGGREIDSGKEKGREGERGGGREAERKGEREVGGEGDGG